MAHYLIIGNGAAGLSAAEVIRRRDPVGQVTIVTDESYPFYSRPGIAYVILGEVSEQQLFARSQSFYGEHRLDLCVATVTGLDLSLQRAYLDDGRAVPYDVCLLATGARAVQPSFPGGDLQGVLTFDTLDDAKEVIRRGRRAKAAVVVGGGITAMELAEGLRHQKARTHLLQRGDRIWPRLFDEHESAIIEARIRHEGIHLHYREEVAAVEGRRGAVAGVHLTSGAYLKCQVVGVAIGVKPNTELVRAQPVAQDQGVLVNPFMQSSISTLFAAGDVAQVYDRWTGRHHLDILWPSAINEGRAAGYNMVEVARGQRPGYAYAKGSPFNAALLFGVHLTVIGRVGNAAAAGDETSLSHLSRGSSNVWTMPLTSNHYSAWDHRGPSSLRIVLVEDRLVGALLMGNQELADPLRHLIENEVDVSAYRDALLTAGDELPATVDRVWRAWQAGNPKTSLGEA